MRSRILQLSRELITPSLFPNKLLSTYSPDTPSDLFMHIRVLGSYTDEAYSQRRAVLKISANRRAWMRIIGHGAQAEVHRNCPSEMALDK
jgi:hypothetical protein